MGGLFDFVGNIGKKVFNREDDESAKAEKVKKSLDSLNLPDVDVQYQNGQVKLSGEALTPEQKEKAVLIAGNIADVEKVNADDLKAPTQTEQVEYYTIQSGDTLSKIAQRYLGNANDYPKIFEANREVIEDPDKIFPGQKIRIPSPKKS